MDVGVNEQRESPLILAVDDDDLALALLTQFLENNDFQVAQADSGETALARFREQRPDLVLMDASMPGMGGIEACAEIKKLPEGEKVPILIVTALEEDEAVDLAFAAGAEDFISKPIRWVVLRQRMLSLLRRQQAEYELRKRQEILRLFMEKTPAAVAMFDREMRYLQASERWKRVYGLGEGPLREGSHFDLVPEQPKRWKKIFQRCLEGEGESREADPFPSPDGDLQWVQWEAHPWLDQNGNKGGLMVFTQDVTARKRVEEEVKEHRDRLESERELIENIIVRMRSNDGFDDRNLRYLLAPVETTAGDVLLSADRPDGARHLMMGDFTGHGLSAALAGPTVSDIFYAMTAKGLPMEAVFLEVNRQLNSKLPTGVFMAGTFLEIAPDGGAVRVWNRSMPEALLFRQGRPFRKLASQHMPLGVMAQAKTDNASVSLQPGDVIYLYSDGVVEAANGEGEMFGLERFEETLIQMVSRGEPLEVVMDAVAAWTGSGSQEDDITLVEVSCVPEETNREDVAQCLKALN